MKIHPVRTEEDYKKALLRIDGLMDATPNTKAGDELDVLATLVEAYEREHFAMNSPDPVEAILFRMEQMGLNRKALEQFLGGRSRVSEVLNRKRSLSMSQIRKLHDGLKIPLENLVGATGRSY
jgi:HTH-type transcriptional regulator/antitoxin HigA